MTKAPKIPEPTIERLAIYARPLEELVKAKIEVISSEKLAQMCDVNPAQVRKDLAFFGEFGVRGVGYNVEDLLRSIKKILCSDRTWTICIVGMGNLGMALVDNDNFKKRNYKFVAAFDSNPEMIGRRLSCGLTVQPFDDIEKTVQTLGIEIGIVATRPLDAQQAADLLMDAGVKAVLNFAPTHLRTPECCIVKNVDFTVKLENLVYHLEKL
ncbi:MAG: redox-sensing transcriptional repressor Rex [Deltaproteobacteria bacterium]|nr:MAG: redox-sensing transcriptional repressor Rex [Desulfobacteraceae bacterium 4484_190.3]RLB15890.1 MAG: redox-sensing transcriptional repressor Rex [Deltaproteobacteria bacterium]